MKCLKVLAFFLPVVAVIAILALMATGFFWLGESEATAYPCDTDTGALYHFDGTTEDACGANDGNPPVNAPYVPGKYGSALDFAGNATSYVHVVPQDQGLEPPDEITIEFWAYLEGGTIDLTAIRKSANCGPGYMVRGIPFTSWGGGFDAPNPCGTANKTSCMADVTPYLNEWAHYAVTYDSTNGCRFYVNCDLLASGPPRQDLLAHSGDLFIGGATVHPDDGGIDGMIDELRISTKARSLSELDACGPTPTPTPPPGPPGVGGVVEIAGDASDPAADEAHSSARDYAGPLAAAVAAGAVAVAAGAWYARRR